MFGIDDIAIALVGSALVGGGMSYLGGKSANSANAAQAQAANAASAQAQGQSEAFNSREAQWAREFNSAEAATARAFNRDEAAKARDFAAAQSATQYQRAVADMKAAGINPLLAYQQGGNAAANVGAASAGAASGPAASVGSYQGAQAHMENVLGPAAATAMQAANAVAGLRQAAAQVDLTKAQTASQVSMARNYDAQTVKTIIDGKNAGLTPQMMAAQIGQLNSQSRLNSTNSAYIAGPQTDLTRQDTYRSGAQGDEHMERTKDIRQNRVSNFIFGRPGSSPAEQIMQPLNDALGGVGGRRFQW